MPEKMFAFTTGTQSATGGKISTCLLFFLHFFRAEIYGTENGFNVLQVF